MTRYMAIARTMATTSSIAATIGKAVIDRERECRAV